MPDNQLPINQNQPQENSPLSSNVETRPGVSQSSKSPKSLVIGLVFLVLLLVSALGYMVYQQQTAKKIANVSTYEECFALNPNGPTTLIYPPQCTTPDGRTFTDPTAKPVETTDQLETDVPSANWPTFTSNPDSSSTYSFKYPSGLIIKSFPVITKENQHEILYFFQNQESLSTFDLCVSNIRQQMKEQDIEIDNNVPQWIDECNDEGVIMTLTYNQNTTPLTNNSQILTDDQNRTWTTSSDRLLGDAFYLDVQLKSKTSNLFSIKFTSNERMVKQYLQITDPLETDKDNPIFILHFQNFITQILSTFRFTNDESAIPDDWKTYSNSDYQFEIKHPTLYTLNLDNNKENYYDNLGKLQNQHSTIYLKALTNIDIYQNASPSTVAKRELIDTGLNHEISEITVNNYHAAITQLHDGERNLSPEDKSQTGTIAHPNQNLFIDMSCVGECNDFSQILSTFRFTN